MNYMLPSRVALYRQLWTQSRKSLVLSVSSYDSRGHQAFPGFTEPLQLSRSIMLPQASFRTIASGQRTFNYLLLSFNHKCALCILLCSTAASSGGSSHRIPWLLTVLQSDLLLYLVPFTLDGIGGLLLWAAGFVPRNPLSWSQLTIYNDCCAAPCSSS